MRKNPYLKQEQEFRPLLMRGALGNDFLNTDAQMMQGLRQALKLTKETYTLNGISFDMGIRTLSEQKWGIVYR